MSAPVSGDSRSYWAFISYSHRDRRWGDWLHKVIETYRVPRRLRGLRGRVGPVPARAFPVFRDREELPGSSDLRANIRLALERSRHLIVICSPHAARSRWVDEEIRTFKAMGRDRVLCLIVDGEPNATDKPDAHLPECFPESLLYRVDGQGHLTPERTEPVAADLRPGGDGRANARLKLLAGVLCTDYDRLKQRDRRRRNLRRLQVGVAGARSRPRPDGSVRQWRMSRGDVVMLRGPYAPIMDRKLVDSAGRGSRLPGASIPTSLRTGLAHGAFGPDGARVVTASEDGSARIWDARRGTELAVLTGHEALLVHAAFSPDGERVVTCSQDASARIWEARSGAELAVLLHNSTSSASSACTSSPVPFRSSGASRGRHLARVGSELLRLPMTALRVSGMP